MIGSIWTPIRRLPQGSPIGLARLSRDLHGRFEAKQAVMTKVIADLREARDGVVEATGIGLGEGTSYDVRWEAAADEVTENLLDPMSGLEPSALAAGRNAALVKGGGPLAALAGRSPLRDRRRRRRGLRT